MHIQMFFFALSRKVIKSMKVAFIQEKKKRHTMSS